MTDPSLTRIRARRAIGSLRAAPAFLTPRTVDRIIALADLLRTPAAAPPRVDAIVAPAASPSPAPASSATMVALQRLREEKAEPRARKRIPQIVVEKPVAPAALPAPHPVRPARAYRKAALEAAPAPRPAPIAQVAATPAPSLAAPRIGFAARRSPLEQASLAVAWLREHRISVSVHSTGQLGTRWNIANEGRPFDAMALIAYAESKGFSS